jgi:hypothetical protein
MPSIPVKLLTKKAIHAIQADGAQKFSTETWALLMAEAIKSFNMGLEDRLDIEVKRAAVELRDKIVNMVGEPAYNIVAYVVTAQSTPSQINRRQATTVKLMYTKNLEDGAVAQTWNVDGKTVESCSYDGPTPPEIIAPDELSGAIVFDIITGHYANYPKQGESVEVDPNNTSGNGHINIVAQSTPFPKKDKSKGKTCPDCGYHDPAGHDTCPSCEGKKEAAWNALEEKQYPESLIRQQYDSDGNSLPREEAIEALKDYERRYGPISEMEMAEETNLGGNLPSRMSPRRQLSEELGSYKDKNDGFMRSQFSRSKNRTTNTKDNKPSRVRPPHKAAK